MMKKLMLIVVAAMMTATAMATSLTDGLVGYWPFNGDAKDYSGNDNNGTTHGVTLTSDRYGNSRNAYQFGEGKYISVGANARLNSISDFTLSMWVKAASWTDETWLAIACKGATRQYGFQILSDKTQMAQTNGCLSVFELHQFQANMDGPAAVFCNKKIPIGQWFHITVTREGRSMHVYYNGQSIGSGMASVAVAGNSGNFDLGRDPAGATEYLSGLMDDVILYNRALSSSEVSALYYGGIRICTIKFDSNDGEGTMASLSALSGMTKALPKHTYCKDGYVFQGWATAEDGEVVYKEESLITVDSDMTLYAVWRRPDCVIHFNANGGVFKDKNGNEVTQFDQHFTYGESKPLFTDELTPMRMDENGNVFLGWSKGTPNISSSDQLIASGREWTWDDDETEVTLYAVWTTTVTVWFYNEETTSSGKSLSPSSLADHLWWSVDDGATGTPKTLRSGETIEVSPGYRTVTFHGDNAYYWIAGLRTVDGVAVDTFKLNICNDYTDALFGSTPSRKGISLYVKVEPPSGAENTASVRFLCSNEIRESLRDRINAADVPFDPSKVRITIGRADYNASGFLVPMMAYSLTGLEAYRTYYLPKGHYYVKYEDVTYDVDTSGGEPYWGAALESNFERQLFELSDEDNEAVKKITVRFDMFGGRNAVRVEFDPWGGECAKSEMWFTYHEGNYQPGPRIDKTLPTPEREGFEFSGWFTAKSGGQWKKEGSDISDCTLFAHWTRMTREWMEENARALFPDLADLDVATVANTAAANGCRTVGECYALGIDPEDPDDDLKIAEFTINDGKPEITLNHMKDGSGNSFEDRVKILGKAALSDVEWQEVPPEGNPELRFFTVGVEMP